MIRRSFVRFVGYGISMSVQARLWATENVEGHDLFYKEPVRKSMISVYKITHEHCRVSAYVSITGLPSTAVVLVGL
jgi:hypothetical protein